MGQGIVTCRLCKSKKLKSALQINGKLFLICQLCTLLQRAEDISYSLTVDLSSGGLIFDYYPFYLERGLPLPVTDDTCFLFSFKAIEVLFQQKGFKINQAQTTDEGKIEIGFEPLNSMEKIQLFEMMKRIGNQFTYFLYSVKKK